MINFGRCIPTKQAFILTVLLLKFVQGGAVKAQGITATVDGTGTRVTQRRQVFDIEAGSLSADGSNLFHSLQTFHLTDGHTANFLADPSVQRIFARIQHGAFIDGTIHITGTQASLFLLNPSGVIFGPNATLNLPADLTVTAGSRINFNQGGFRAVGSNNYGLLNGSPTAFIFNRPGTIRNEGGWVLPPGQSLTLLGRQVTNVGSLTGDVDIVEVSDGQIIQVSRAGSLLNLEFSERTWQNNSGDASPTTSMLPNLLTHGDAEHADKIITSSDGQLLLSNSSLSRVLTEDRLSVGPNPIDATTTSILPQSTIARAHAQTTDSQPIISQTTDSQTTGNQMAETTPPSRKHQDTQSQDHPSDTPSDGLSSSAPPQITQHHIHRAVLNTTRATAALENVETLRTQEFSDYFGRDLGAKDLTLPEIQQLLTQVHHQTGNRSVIVYIKTPKLTTDTFEPTSTVLELLIFKPTGEPVSLTIPGVSQTDLLQTVEQFRRALMASGHARSKRYLPAAQTLYQWLIKPIEDELGPESIDTVLFSMDSGLRTVPMAALHDGEQFLIEKYSVGMIPSLGLMDPHYQPLGRAQVLAMGASQFESLQPLPAVPAEIETISKLWPGRTFLNETFTQQNLISQQQHTPAQIIHLATHAEFSAGNAENSYIQLWDEQLQLSDIHRLGWDRPTVDLLVLSACRTALGDANAEMGFAGLAVAAGVKSALASLWTVSDVGTLALMSEFYHQLMDAEVKSEALRAAQLAMLHGETHLEEKQLPIADSQLPEELQDDLAYLDLSHPFYWAGFTLIGSPW